MLTRTEAAEIEARFADLKAGALGREGLASLPAAEVVEAIVRAAFWASLRREEGQTPKISLAFVPPDPAEPAFAFATPLTLEPGTLTRLAPAVERPGVHLGVWQQGDALRLWGIVSRLPHLTFVVEVFEPGLLAIKYSRSAEFGKFGNVAVLEGDRLRIVDEASIRTRSLPTMIASLIGDDPFAGLPAAGAVLLRLAASMSRHGHGGTLLVVADNDGWLDSIAHPIPYVGLRPSSTLASLISNGNLEDRGPHWGTEIGRAIARVAGLTAVDGATVMNRRFEVLAFGAMIRRSDESGSIKELKLIEPVVGDVPAIVDPTGIGNSRHLAAAQFVYDRRDALALVSSQDGRFTVLAWSEADEMVHAYRIETLLM